MDKIYSFVGFAIVWIAIIAILIFIIGVAITAVHQVIFKRIYGDAIRYYLGFKLKSHVLREAYMYLSQSTKFKTSLSRSLILKYRLRNINKYKIR